MTVVVTGGSGLVGSHVIAALVAAGERVRALVRPPARTAVESLGAVAVIGDVTDPAGWDAACSTPGGVRAIIHAAALVTQPVTLDEFLAINVGGTEAAIAAARAAGARLVHVSSVAVYGRRAAYTAGAGTVGEDFPQQPLAPHEFYARSKRLAEARLWEATARGGLWAVALRPNVVYGERDRLFSPRLVRLVRAGVVPRIGPGGNRLSLVYAGNVAAAAVAALDADVPTGRAYNVTNDGGLTQRDLVAAIASALGRRVTSVRLPRTPAALAVSAFLGLRRAWRPGRYAGASGAVDFLGSENPYRSDRARAELGWQPAVAPREAVHRTVRWVLENETPGH